jgi:D-sedoheptulose 7-phosphate isomerase
MDTASFLCGYFSEVQRLLDEIDPKPVQAIADKLLAAWQQNRRVLLMGNGGSSSSVSHIVNDMQKNLQLTTGRALRALCLSDCTPLMMAWANDTAWDNVFAPQVACWAEPGDLVIGVSGSGNSMNIINGILAGNAAGATTIGLAGFEGGKLKDAAKQCLIVHSDNMQQIEDIHMILLHSLFSDLLRRAGQERISTE